MDDILSPIATIEIDDINESFNNYCVIYDEINGNLPSDFTSKDSVKYYTQSLQSSLENLVNNFDTVISECFTSDEKIDSLSPISEKYRPSNTCIDKNQLWLSLTGSVSLALNLDWHSFKSFEEFTHAINVSRQEDFINQNLDLPDDEELTSAMDHHSLVTSLVPSDYEPLKTADEVIEEIDMMMGLSFNDEFNNGDMSSNIDESDLLYNEENIIFRRNVLTNSNEWIHDLDKMSTKELNDVLDEYDDSIRNLSSLLVYELAEREDLEYEKEQRDLFVKLIHDIEQRQRLKPDEFMSKKLSTISNDLDSSNETIPKRSNSWRSIFSYGSPTKRQKNHKIENMLDDSRISRSSDNLNKTIGVSIPIHRHTRMDKDLLLMFNQMLQAMVANPPLFNQLLTNYILNVYAFADDISLDMSMEML